ncbi:type II toxin-antitoxin system mRNA interferase toxin, RelE/StbE family [Patescibacteria group bacterium]|nr:type II toxin-antitoxin system mRNA interferase toxin, RelE/StbE family [Patescibacteria group bacterium]MBU4481062.1 type II toxin-antitoxin system mRNA interferase toxin, RelE/StbE family [Patescibacteria group bacterium]
MEIFFKPSFIKDFKKLPEEIKNEIRRVCLIIFPSIKDLREFKEFEIKPIKGFKNFYRIKLKEYRIGFKKENSQIIFMRAKHRKDIYRYFP